MYKKILVTLDGSELSECVLPHGEAFRKGFPGCEMILIRVVESIYEMAISHSGETISQDQWKAREIEAKTAAEDYLKRVAARLEQGGAPVRFAVKTGRVADSIVDYVEMEKIDVILMATHGRSGVSRWVMGSIAEKVLRTAHVPVLVVRAPGAGRGF